MQAEILQHNIQSMFANRQLNITGKKKAKSTEKLSSGYKINRSGDDAAGLAISEKMRWQVRGLNKASQNISDGISFVQTAEGYLGEVTSILQRMNELAVQSSNDTNTEQDRQQLDAEVQELKKETNRIFKTADFNTLKIWQVPYSPEPVLQEKGTEITYIQRSTSLPDGVLPDEKSAEAGKLANTYTNAGGTTYKAATYLDFSNLNMSDLSKMDGLGFYSTCCTCDDHYSITFDSSTDQHKVDGEENHFTYTVGVKDCETAADVVQRIVDATSGNPNSHFTNYAVSDTDATGNTLVIYDNRRNQTAQGSYGTFGTGVTYEEIKSYSDVDFQVFNRGIDANGNPLYGGVEINDVRHTWEEMGISLKSDGKTFDGDQEAVFYDYTGERVQIKVKDGDEAPNISRNYSWDAREDGIYVNNVMATTWNTLGIKDEGNGGEYTFDFHNMELTFLVPNNSTLEDVKDGINARVLEKKYSWDLNVGDTTTDTAVSVTNWKQYGVTEANKDIIGEEYYIKADATGITLTDSGNNAHTVMEWKDFLNQTKASSDDPDYPIADWGVSDADGKGTKSNLITFDDTATYVYTDIEQSSLPVTFSFQLSDEAGLATVISELDGAKFQGTVTAPHTTGAAAENDANFTVSVTADYMDFETQRAYGRDFNDANATLGGSVTSTFVTGEQIAHITNYYETDIANGDKTETSNTEVYLQNEDGTYYKAQKVVNEWQRTTTRDQVDVDDNNAHYEYSGNFAGYDMDDVTGQTFNLRTITTTAQNRVDAVTQNTYYVDVDTAYTAEELAEIEENDGVTLVRENLSDIDEEEHLSQVQDWQDLRQTVEKQTNAFSENVTVSSTQGKAMQIGFSYKKNTTSGGDAALSFQAKGLAERSFVPSPKNKNNTSKAAEVTSATVVAPKRVLNIQAGAQGLQGIPIEWEGLNNTILGIAQTHIRDYKHAQMAMDEVQDALEKITTQRSKWGAYQNRLEHSKLIDDNTSENSQAAESRIRDTDMAKEMVDYSKNDILQQAGQAVLSQANQSKQGILSLLQ